MTDADTRPNRSSVAVKEPGFFRKLITQPAFLDLLGVAVIGLIGDAKTRGREAQAFLKCRREGR